MQNTINEMADKVGEIEITSTSYGANLEMKMDYVEQDVSKFSDTTKAI